MTPWWFCRCPCVGIEAILVAFIRGLYSGLCVGYAEARASLATADARTSPFSWSRCDSMLFTSTETMRLIRKGGRGYGGGGRGRVYLSLHCHHQNDFCIKVGSDESHFNVSELCGTKSQDSECPQTTTFEEKGEPKQIQTEVLLLIIIDRFYIALFSALEQTRCARM